MGCPRGLTARQQLYRSPCRVLVERHCYDSMPSMIGRSIVKATSMSNCNHELVECAVEYKDGVSTWPTGAEKAKGCEGDTTRLSTRALDA